MLVVCSLCVVGCWLLLVVVRRFLLLIGWLLFVVVMLLLLVYVVSGGLRFVVLLVVVVVRHLFVCATNVLLHFRCSLFVVWCVLFVPFFRYGLLLLVVCCCSLWVARCVFLVVVA